MAFTLTIFYAIASWCSVGACRPILATISDESDRSSIFGWQVGLEGSFAALFGAPVVGWMSESLFEYNAHKGVVGGDAYRGRALGRAMGWVCLVGWSISFFIFSALHYTVPRDAKTGSDSVPVTEKADPEARLFSPKADAYVFLIFLKLFSFKKCGEFLANFERPVLGCIIARFCK